MRFLTSRSRSLRTLPGVMAAVIGVSALAACTPSSQDGGSGGADADAAKPESLNMLYATAEANAAAVQALVPAFEEEFGFALNIDTQPYDALQQKVFAEFAADSSYYDIIIVDTPWAPALASKLEPLGDYIKDPELNDVADADLDDFIPKVFFDTAVYNRENPAAHFPDAEAAPDVDAIQDKGFEVLGLPIQANALVMAYREDMFEDPQEQAGFEEATGRSLEVPATWDEFTEVARYFTRPDEKLYGTTVMAGVGDWATDDFKTLLAGWGGNGHLVGDDQSLAFNTPEGVAALQYYQDLIQDHKVVPPGSTSASWDEAASLFGAGTTAMSMNYHTLELDDKVDGSIGYAVVPAGEDRGPHFGTWMLGINSNSNNKAWAYRAITWLTASEQQITMTEQQLHPTRVSVYDEITGAGSEDPELRNFYEVLGESLSVGVGRARLTNYMEVSNAIAKAVNRAANGDTTPEEALSGAAEEVTRLLTEAGYEVPSS